LVDPTEQYTLQVAVQDQYRNTFVIIGEGPSLTSKSRLYFGHPNAVMADVLQYIPTDYSEVEPSRWHCGERQLRPHSIPDGRELLRWQAATTDDPGTACLVQQYKHGAVTRYGWRSIETPVHIALRACTTLAPLDRKRRPHTWANARLVVIGDGGQCLKVELTS
jgi:hypothetical protein